MRGAECQNKLNSVFNHCHAAKPSRIAYFLLCTFSSCTFFSIHLLLQLGGNAEPISDDAKTHVILKACSTGTGQVPWHLAR